MRRPSTSTSVCALFPPRMKTALVWPAPPLLAISTPPRRCSTPSSVDWPASRMSCAVITVTDCSAAPGCCGTRAAVTTVSVPAYTGVSAARAPCCPATINALNATLRTIPDDFIAVSLACTRRPHREWRRRTFVARESAKTRCKACRTGARRARPYARRRRDRRASTWRMDRKPAYARLHRISRRPSRHWIGNRSLGRSTGSRAGIAIGESGGRRLPVRRRTVARCRSLTTLAYRCEGSAGIACETTHAHRLPVSFPSAAASGNTSNEARLLLQLRGEVYRRVPRAATPRAGCDALYAAATLSRACCASFACCDAYAWCAAASASPTLIGRPMSDSTEPSAERHSITLSGRHE